MVILCSMRSHMKMDSASIIHLPGDIGVQYSKIELAVLDDQLEEDALFRNADEVNVEVDANATYISDDSEIDNENVDTENKSVA